jgi:uncharacterized membrane protein YeaQ/YmgE (transglycosylase-associated protein family)
MGAIPRDSTSRQGGRRRAPAEVVVVDVVLWVIIGAVAGLLALLVMYRAMPRTPWQWAGAMAVGIAGGWLGGHVTNLLGLQAVNWVGSLVVAFSGAVGLIALIARMRPSRRR